MSGISIAYFVQIISFIQDNYKPKKLRTDPRCGKNGKTNKHGNWTRKSRSSKKISNLWIQ